MAATCIVAGVVAFAWAATMWKKKHDDGQHSRWVTFLMVLAGLGLGIGTGYLEGINIVQDKIGYVPLWVPVVLVAGFGFILEFRGWNDHPTRTPVLGFLTALVLMLAAGHAVVNATTHEIHNVRTTSNVVPASTQGKG
jgi:hypothetical protein